MKSNNNVVVEIRDGIYRNYYVSSEMATRLPNTSITLCCEIVIEQDPKPPHKAAAPRLGNPHLRSKIWYIQT